MHFMASPATFLTAAYERIFFNQTLTQRSL